MSICFSCSGQRGYSQYDNRGQYYDYGRMPQPRYDNNRYHDPYYTNPPADSRRYSNPYEFYYPQYDRDAYYVSPTGSDYYYNDSGVYESSR